jgi:hypothetical protein
VIHPEYANSLAVTRALHARGLCLGFFQEGVRCDVLSACRKKNSWLWLPREPDYPHQLGKSWIGADGIEYEVSLQAR